MKSERYLDEEATIRKGVEALIRELGPVEAMRFLSIPRERRQESVKRHRESRHRGQVFILDRFICFLQSKMQAEG